MLTTSASRRHSGTTLIEALIALTILGIVLALAAPAVGDWLKNAQIRTAAESLQDGLQQARNEAVRRNTAVEFRLISASTWEVRFADTSITDRILGSRSSAEGSPDVVTATAPPAATIVTFDGMGRRMTANTDGSAVLTGACVDLSPLALDAAKTRELQLNVSLSGQVRMCDPKASSTDVRHCTEPLINPCGT